MIPSVGRIVQYTLGEWDADEVNRRRSDSVLFNAGDPKTGFVVHTGNPVRQGDKFPLLITRVWNGDQPATESTAVNGQVFLDGNDTLWVTSRAQGDGESQWREFPRV